jgi:hypothetical protein
MTMSRLFSLAFVTLTPLLAFASIDVPVTTTPAVAEISIVQKNGQEDGIAELKVKGKTHKITAHAVRAWSVRGGLGALILVVEQKGSAAKQYTLRYYDLDSGRHRTLGAVPFNVADIHESNPTAGLWAFSLTGKDLSTGQPFTVVGDDRAR